MAKKYVDISASFNGNGTLPTQASSDGGAGAWNVFNAAVKGTPAYGSISPGDDLWVRTADNTGNLVETITATITPMGGLTAAAPLRVFFDDGVVWSDSGVFELLITSNITLNLPNYFQIFCNENNFKFTRNASGNVVAPTIGNSTMIGTTWNFTSGSGTETLSFPILSSTSPFFHDMKMNIDRSYGTTTQAIFSFTQHTGARLSKIVLDVSKVPLNRVNTIIRITSTGQNLINGLKIIGDKESTNLLYDSTTNPHKTIMVNVESDGLMVEANSSAKVANGYTQNILSINGEYTGWSEEISTAFIQWRNNKNYPTLSAKLPDGTPWSIMVFNNNSGKGMIGYITQMNEYYDNDSGIKTVSIDLLLNDYITTPLKSEWFFTLIYTDNNDVRRVETSYDIHHSQLEESDVLWSTTVYGSTSYKKWKMSILTEYPIKKDTMLLIDVFTGYKPYKKSDFYFINPQPKII